MFINQFVVLVYTLKTELSMQDVFIGQYELFSDGHFVDHPVKSHNVMIPANRGH